MKRYKKIIIIGVCVIVGLGVLHWYNYCEQKKLSPEEVIQKYYNAYNNKNIIALRSTETENLKSGFNDINHEKIDIIKIDEKVNEKQSYIQYGRGAINNISEDRVKVYKVSYKNIGDEEQNELWIKFTLIKETEDGPWLIDDIGY